MSIKLKQAAQQALNALDEATTYTGSPSWSPSMTDECIAAASALRASLAQQPTTHDPVVPDSSEHLRVIASLGDALRRLSFAAQTTGGTDGPDAELQSAIGQAEQALSLGGIWQAMSATPEPVGFTYQAEIDYANSTGGNGSFWRVPPDLDDEAVPLYDHPAPSVPAAVARDAISTVREHYRGTDWGKAAESICDAIDAMLAAK